MCSYQNPGPFELLEFVSCRIAGMQRWHVGSGRAAEASQREVLRLEIARLRNATAHLESSNAELKEALAADPSDKDFKDALGVGRICWHGCFMS